MFKNIFNQKIDIFRMKSMHYDKSVNKKASILLKYSYSWIRCASLTLVVNVTTAN